MKYYAMIDGEQRGPYELSQLAEAGVRPDTYVWTKGLDDWIKAEEDADICRMFRQRISSLMHPSMAPASSTPNSQATPITEQNTEEQQSAGWINRIGFGFPETPTPEEVNPTIPPRPTLLAAVFVTVFFFPPTGIAAIYYSMKCQKLWNASRLTQGDESQALRHKAHSANRMARMLTGISFFLGFILWAFISRILA